MWVLCYICYAVELASMLLFPGRLWGSYDSVSYITVYILFPMLIKFTWLLGFVSDELLKFMTAPSFKYLICLINCIFIIVKEH